MQQIDLFLLDVCVCVCANSQVKSSLKQPQSIVPKWRLPAIKNEGNNFYRFTQQGNVLRAFFD